MIRCTPLLSSTIHITYNISKENVCPDVIGEMYNILNSSLLKFPHILVQGPMYNHAEELPKRFFKQKYETFIYFSGLLIIEFLH
jgi:hypothetical protein